jgi:hypothetical protein
MHITQDLKCNKDLSILEKGLCSGLAYIAEKVRFHREIQKLDFGTNTTGGWAFSET